MPNTEWDLHASSTDAWNSKIANDTRVLPEDGEAWSGAEKERKNGWLHLSQSAVWRTCPDSPSGRQPIH